VAFPLLLLALVEGGLRLAGVGYRPGFTVGCRVQGRAARCENPDFSRRFFPAAAVRRPTSFAIPEAKGPRTFRIFVVGESAAQGDPEPSFGVGRFLGAMLQERFPALDFEVVNTGVVAVNSHVLLPIVRDLARRSGDLFVIYAGNNEVVGPYGAGTVLTRGSARLPLVRASLALQATRIGQLLGRLASPSSGTSGEWRGMEMFLEQQVRATDPAMEQVYASFERNLSDLVDVARDSGARVVVSTVGTRLGDFAPFASLNAPGLDPASRAAFQAGLARGAALESEGKWSEALAAYQAAAALDPGFAELQYRMARCQEHLGDLPAARAGFARARDLDTLRFRADGRINDTIRAVARRAGPGVQLVDGEAALASASPQGIPGAGLFYEHAHLTPEGNYQLALALFPAVVAALPASVHPPGAPVEPPTFEACVRRLALTGYDRYRVAKEVLRRLQRPPFTGQIDHAAQVAHWERERDRQAMETFTNSDTAYRAAIARSPFDPWLLVNHAVLLDNRDVFEARQGLPDRGRAIAPLQRSLELLPQMPEARIRLAEALIRVGRPDEAIAQCQALLRFRPTDAGAYRTMAYAWSRKGRPVEAAAAEERARQFEGGARR
jgi:tetratricopeptide (TPR) repeat protein